MSERYTAENFDNTLEYDKELGYCLRYSPLDNGYYAIIPLTRVAQALNAPQQPSREELLALVERATGIFVAEGHDDCNPDECAAANWLREAVLQQEGK